MSRAQQVAKAITIYAFAAAVITLAILLATR